MATLRKTTEQEKEVFKYLNELRESGITNMFGARPYIINNFVIEGKEAGRLLTIWMKVFNDEGKYDEIESD